MKNYKKGFVIPLVIAIIALLGIGGGYYLYNSNQKIGPGIPPKDFDPSRLQKNSTTTNVVKGDYNGNCNAPYTLHWNKNVNEKVSSAQDAYNILINLETYFSKDSKPYLNYKNSTISDVIYEDVFVQGKGENSVKMYTLQGETGITSEGLLYIRMKCL